MLFFIPECSPFSSQTQLFKYISCYSLSQDANYNILPGYIFKYISCYSLSLSGDCTVLVSQLFKYISCYSLSLILQSWLLLHLHLNTSHVILYRVTRYGCRPKRIEFKYISCYSLSDDIFSVFLDNLEFKYISCYSLSQSITFTYLAVRNLNTSHVILYPTGQKIYFRGAEFKYISCYSLSYYDHARETIYLIFKYISCYSLSLSFMRI